MPHHEYHNEWLITFHTSKSVRVWIHTTHITITAAWLSQCLIKSIIKVSVGFHCLIVCVWISTTLYTHMTAALILIIIPIEIENFHCLKWSLQQAVNWVTSGYNLATLHTALFTPLLCVFWIGTLISQSQQCNC